MQIINLKLRGPRFQKKKKKLLPVIIATLSTNRLQVLASFFPIARQIIRAVNNMEAYFPVESRATSGTAGRPLELGEAVPT